ncbi:MAG: toll/interleukin-1 receptor domain-containing protein, partial [Anaerolineae bacterium]|nr:toll/interleukin-1 receptor domain-containing protein [Anaerolineae bacterium]
MAQNLRLFINYRRADHALVVENLRTHFMYRYGRENVFMDFDSIPPFTQFADFIREQVRAVDALVMIMGPRWIELLQQKAQAGEPDYVLIELEEAIQHNKVIAPILIENATLPNKRDLPAFLHPVFDTVNIPSVRAGLDMLNNIDRLTKALENEIRRQGKQRSVQQTRPAAEHFNIHEAIGFFYEAQHGGDLPAALVWLEKIQHSGAAIPGFFKLSEYQANLQAAIKQQEEERRRYEVADYLYGFIRQMHRFKQPAQVIEEAFIELWKVIPDYDPDGIISDYKKKQPPPPITKKLAIVPTPDAVRQIIGEPFEWCEVPAGEFLYG